MRAGVAVREYLLCLVVAAAVAYLCTPLVRMFAIRWGAMAAVRDRDVHDRPIPRLGGLAMFAGLIASLLVAWRLPGIGADLFSDEGQGAQEIVAVLIACTIIVALGIVDDRWGLDAPTKFIGQALAGGVVALQGIQLLWIPWPGNPIILDPASSVLLTVLVVIITVNAVNFVDGLDGLAAGIVGIAALALFAYAYLLSGEFGYERAVLSTLICACLAGVCLGFLPHNLNPARIFMGDTGSMLIGLLLSVATINLVGRLQADQLSTVTFLPTLLPVFLPVAVVAVPLLDLVLAVIRRTRARRNPLKPDKQHLHHRLLEMGHSQRRAVLLMHAWTALLAFTAVSMAVLPVSVALVAGSAGLVGLVLAVRWPRIAAVRAAKAGAGT